MNLFASVSLAMLFVLAWQVAGRARTDPAGARLLAVTLFAGLAAMAILCWNCFFAAPAGLATLAAGCTLMALLCLRQSPAA
jgi:hypothetical protein